MQIIIDLTSTNTDKTYLILNKEVDNGIPGG